MNILSLVVLALLGEAVWETAKMVWQNGKISIDRIGALVVGELLAIGAGTDLMAMVGVPLHIPYVGMILTGLLISRGANFIHDLLASINNVQQNTKAVLPSIMDTGTVTKEQTAATIAVGETEKENPTVENSEPEQPVQQ
jgi:hypothetical protein